MGSDGESSPYLCMSDDEYAMWQATNDRVVGQYHAIAPCLDCTPEYRASQRALGTCPASILVGRVTPLPRERVGQGRQRAKLLHPCLVCGRRTTETRCPEHARIDKRKRGPGWGRRSRLARTEHPYCAQCGARTSKLHLDHVVPVALGGADGPVQVLCQTCNLRKGARLAPSGGPRTS